MSKGFTQRQKEREENDYKKEGCRESSCVCILSFAKDKRRGRQRIRERSLPRGQALLSP